MPIENNLVFNCIIAKRKPLLPKFPLEYIIDLFIRTRSVIIIWNNSGTPSQPYCLMHYLNYSQKRIYNITFSTCQYNSIWIGFPCRCIGTRKSRSKENRRFRRNRGFCRQSTKMENFHGGGRC